MTATATWSAIGHFAGSAMCSARVAARSILSPDMAATSLASSSPRQRWMLRGLSRLAFARC